MSAQGLTDRLAMPLFIGHSLVWWTWVEQNLWGTMVFVTIGAIVLARRPST